MRALHRKEYLAYAFIPFAVIMLIGVIINNSTIFVSLLAAFVIYRAVLDYIWLKQRGYIKKWSLLLFIIPVYTFFYFEKLYFTD